MLNSLEPFSHVAGSRTPKLLVVGEAWGEHEERLREPFVGFSGWELFVLLSEVFEFPSELQHECAERFFERAGRKRNTWSEARQGCLEHAGIMLTNVFNLRPRDNKVENLCNKREELPADYSLPALKTGNYVRPEYLVHVERLWHEIEQTKPNLVLCTGNVACWALFQCTPMISKLRGAITRTARGHKALATYHPAAMLREWPLRPIIAADLIKAHNECQFAHIVRPERRVLVAPTLAELHEWEQLPARQYGVDIETHRGQIKSIAFALSPSNAVCVPFIVTKFVGKKEFFVRHYWDNVLDEIEAWNVVERLLHKPVPKVFQNGLFDLQYIWRAGIAPVMCEEDTMLQHHALYPELPKSLGFLGTIYTNEASWKMMRTRGGEGELKREE